MTHHPGYYYPYSSSSCSENESLSSQFHSAILDTEFLLRCALTHDWETLTSFCQLLQDIFTLNVPDRPWKWQKNRIAVAKLQLLAQDQWGNTALHAACYNNAPARVVRALLQAASVAPPSPLQIHTVLSRDQSTPLLVACATGACLEVIQALLTPPAGLTNAGATVFQADQQGATPLTELAVNYELQRKSPLHVRTSKPLDQVRLNESPPDPLLESFQAKLQALLEAAWSHCFSTTPMPSMVHGMAHVAAVCPPVVVRLVLREYVQSHPPTEATLPLHLAVLQPHLKSHNNNHLSLVRHAYCVEQLLEADPVSGAAPVPNHNNLPCRSPFLQAIAAGCFWHTNSSTNRSKSMTGNHNKGPLKLLWQAHPQDLSRVDPLSGMLPIRLAATLFSLRGKADDQTNHSTELHILQVDTIYNLLRLHPQVLEEISE